MKAHPVPNSLGVLPGHPFLLLPYQTAPPDKGKDKGNERQYRRPCTIIEPQTTPRRSGLRLPPASSLCLPLSSTQRGCPPGTQGPPPWPSRPTAYAPPALSGAPTRSPCPLSSTAYASAPSTPGTRRRGDVSIPALRCCTTGTCLTRGGGGPSFFRGERIRSLHVRTVAGNSGWPGTSAPCAVPSFVTRALLGACTVALAVRDRRSTGPWPCCDAP